MKGRYLILVTAIVAALVLIAFYAEYPRATSTKVASITANPIAYNGKQVSLFGTVVDRSEDGFALADGTGKIEVKWAGTLPAVGTTNVFVQGVLSGEAVTATGVAVWPV